MSSPFARSMCRFGDHALEQQEEGGPWVSGYGMVYPGVTQECPDAPNPDEGPMPHHEPGVIAYRDAPRPQEQGSGWPPPALPYIPRLP